MFPIAYGNHSMQGQLAFKGGVRAWNLFVTDRGLTVIGVLHYTAVEAITLHSLICSLVFMVDGKLKLHIKKKKNQKNETDGICGKLHKK